MRLKVGNTAQVRCGRLGPVAIHPERQLFTHVSKLGKDSSDRPEATRLAGMTIGLVKTSRTTVVVEPLLQYGSREQATQSVRHGRVSPTRDSARCLRELDRVGMRRAASQLWRHRQGSKGSGNRPASLEHIADNYSIRSFYESPSMLGMCLWVWNA